MIRRLFISTLVGASLLGSAFSVVAQDPATIEVETADVEERARVLGKTLRCVVCQNQSIEDSDAELAADMRALVRERLAVGDSEAEITAMMRDRYGDFVLLRPPVQRNTLVLWLGPGVLIFGGLIWLVRRRAGSPPVMEDAALTADEQAALDALRRNS